MTMDPTIRPKKRICVVVLGDFGRSPRMQYHAMALSSHGFEVDVVAYGGSKPHKRVLDDQFITQHLMTEPPDFNKYVPRILSYIFRVIWQTFVLLYYLFKIKKPSHILVQNPPSITTLPVSLLVCWLQKSSLVIDWHNYGYTILGLKLGNRHPMVKICSWIEGVFGSYGKNHFCVTRAMKEDLAANWNIQAVVLYDRPSEIFHPISLKEKHEFLLRLSDEFSVLKDGESNTRFTKQLPNGEIKLRADRPPLVVSSTSWTPDEDFSILLTAFEGYENAASLEDLPNIYCLISGKGPMQNFYKEEIQKRNFQKIQIFTLWLPAEDYPNMLASADLGISLHKSSSGLDLPMKVVDMFGCGLPVYALNFSCLYELVKPGCNGRIFSNAKQLTEELIETFQNFPDGSGAQLLQTYQNNLATFRASTWENSWSQLCLPIFIQ